jgi:hypothetical protein
MEEIKAKIEVGWVTRQLADDPPGKQKSVIRIEKKC